MIVRKLNYYKLISFIVILALVIFGIIKLISLYNYRKSDEYAFLNIGYSKEEINTLNKELNKEELSKVKTIKYDKNIIKFVSEKYFIFENLTAYLEYKKENKDIEINDIVAIINTESNVEWIDESKDTDTSKGDLMLVNRLYGLKSDYEPDDIVDVSVQYAYDGVKISNSILDKITLMIDAAKEEGYTFVLSDGYRSYKEQEELFNSFKDSYGESEADKTVARPGHSEYQTGLSFDIAVYGKVIEDVSTSEEYKWLQDNAYKYGFIFRYTSDKEDLTKFNASEWRLRYVGSSASEIIYNEKICFEEYYAYFVAKEN